MAATVQMFPFVLSICLSVTVADKKQKCAAWDLSCYAKSDPFAPFVVGNNTCFMAQGYYPVNDLLAILPENMTIPPSSVMDEYYPDVLPLKDYHPVLLSFCEDQNVHDLKTNVTAVKDMNELLFIFPVIYNHQNKAHLCSYIPVLYLDSLVGTIGGLYYGLRKEYHPNMKTHETNNSKSWYIEDIINASFIAKDDEQLSALPHFFVQSFTNPFVTISYPPSENTMFYQARLYPVAVKNASDEFQWNYKGAVVDNHAGSRSVYSKYWFTMSSSMNYSQYFGSNDAAKSSVLA